MRLPTAAVIAALLLAACDPSPPDEEAPVYPVVDAVVDQLGNLHCPDATTETPSFEYGYRWVVCQYDCAWDYGVLRAELLITYRLNGAWVRYATTWNDAASCP